ncbi:hypothetical protein CBI33_22535 [Rhodococcus erythropolis]|nr:hypothetical protein CBI33_22535 [Rhodococcus erythropolis]
MSYQARLGETPEALNNSDLLERIDQLRKEATTAYDRRDHEATEGWVQMVERYKAVAQSRGLI